MTKKILAALLLSLAAACGGGGGSNPLNPVNQPEIVNATNDFQFQVTGVSDGTGSFTYDWVNTGTAAKVDRTSDVSTGSVGLTLRDASGAVVFTDSATASVPWSGSATTGTGTAGSWTIQVDFSHTTGTVNFRAQGL
ncbi:MAG TPA: hypothetical protein VLS93_12215 [Anaeromyxobacteraceae bacterium]|nr:hypothetical protein [Anaeromyxobacteraceae bacterium]